MAERRIDLLHVPRFGKTPMVMEHIKAAMLGEPVPRFEPVPMLMQWQDPVHGNVTWHDFKRTVDLPIEGVKQIPSPNQPLAIELWKTFNTCALCHAESRCKTVCSEASKTVSVSNASKKYCNFKRR